MTIVDAQIVAALVACGGQYASGLFRLTTILGVEYRNAWDRVQRLQTDGLINVDIVRSNKQGGKCLRLSLAQ